MRTILQATAALGLLAFASCDLQATPSLVCGDRDAMVAIAAVNWKETPRDWVIDLDGSVLELLASDRGSYTILRTNPAGAACIVDVGMNASIPAVPQRLGA